MNDTSSQPPYGAAPPPPPPPPSGGGPQPSAAGGPAPQPGPLGPSDPRHGLTRFFDAIRGIGLVRSQHRVVGGVCGGIAERTGIDPTVVRVVAVVLGIFGGIGVLLYGLAWLLLPEPDGRIHGEQVLHGKVDAGAIGAIIVTVLALGGGPGSGWRHWGPGIGWHGGLFGLLWGLTGSAVVIAVIVLAVYLAVRGRGNRSGPTGSGPGYAPAGYPPAGYQPGSYAPTTPPQPPVPPVAPAPTAPFGAEPNGPATAPPTAPGAPPAPSAATSTPMYGGAATLTVPAPPSVPPFGPPMPTGPAPSRRRPSLGLFAPVVGGLALVGAGVSALVTHNGHYRVSTAAMAWAVALGVIALALVVGGLLGRRSGVVTVFALVALVGTLAAAVIPKADHTQALGERTWRPASTAPATGGYALGIGHATLDLSVLDLAALDSGDPPTVPVSVGIGQLTIEVPPGLSLVVRTSVGAGSLPAPDGSLVVVSEDNLTAHKAFRGQDEDGNLGGADIKRTLTIGTGTPQLIVNAKVGVGEIDIEQVSR